MHIDTRFRPIVSGFICSLALYLLLAPAAAAQEGQRPEPFVFSKVDTELLEQANLLERKLEKEGLIYADEAVTAYVERVGRNVLPAAQAPERVVWRFRVLRDPLPNALALPNGSIFVTTGLLSLLEHEAQLANVLAHEIVHVRNRHSYLEYRSYRKKMVTIHVLEAVGAGVPITSAAGAIVSVAASVAQPVVAATINGYSRELEKEADLDALDRLVASGYDPSEMAKTFELLQKSYDVEMLKVYYTDHPKLQERIAYVNESIKKLPPAAAARPNAEHRERYLARVEEAVRHNLQLDIESGRFRTAVATGKKLTQFNPEDAENFYCLAEAYRALGPRTPEPVAVEVTEKAKDEHRKLRRRMTLAEEETSLMATETGQSRWKENRAQAEELYLEALSIKPSHAKAHRGLGMLSEKYQQPQRAIEHYRKYLELQPNALDRLRISNRIATLEAQIKPAN